MKIKLPLIVDECNEKFIILDQRGQIICDRFYDQQTAQLLADCFEFCADIGATPTIDKLQKMPTICIRAAEAVEG